MRKGVAHVGHRGQTQVGLVATVQTDGFVIGHAGKRRLDLESGCLEGSGQKAFHHFVYAVGLGIGHLQINLRKFRLAVSAQVFVTEAANDLKIFVEARDHQNLLEQLWRLRQCVEGAGLYSTGNKVVARAFRGRPGHEGRLDLEKALRRQVAADRHGYLMTQFDIELHGVAAQVDVAVLQPHLLVGQNCFAGQEWRLLGLVEDAEFVGHELNFAGRNVLVDSVGIALLHRTDSGDDILVAQNFSLVMQRRIPLPVKDHLGCAGAVANVNEDKTSEVAAAVNPAHEHRLTAGVRDAEGTAGMRTLQLA